MFNFLTAFQYLSEAAQAAELVASTNLNNAESDVNLGLQLVQLFSPKTANTSDFKTAEELMASLSAAEQGQSGVVATIPFQSNGKNLNIVVTVQPA